MNAAKNLFLSFVASAAFSSAAGMAQPSPVSALKDKVTPKKEAADTIDYFKRFNSITAHELKQPKPFKAHTTEFAECMTTFTQGSTVSTIGINVKDSTYFLKVYDNHANYQGVHECITAYMGTYAQQDSSAQALFPKAGKAIADSKTKRKPYSHASYLIGAPDSNTIVMTAPMGGNFKNKVILDMDKKTMSQCECEPVSDVTKHRFANNSKLVEVAEKYRHSKKYKVNGCPSYFH